MNEVIEKLCRIKTQYAINKLNPSSTDMIFIQYEELCLELNNQLQSYKQKEDKLREKIYEWGEATQPLFQKELLEILNEGE